MKRKRFGNTKKKKKKKRKVKDTFTVEKKQCAEYSIIDGCRGWKEQTERFLLNKNPKLQYKFFRSKNIKLMSNVWVFEKLHEIGISLGKNERMIVLGHENETRGGFKYFACGTTNAIREIMIDNNECHLHEVIFDDTPIKLFLDIEMEIKKKINFESNKNALLKEIDKFKFNYDNLLKLHIPNVTNDWVLTSSSSIEINKISYHLIGNHYVEIKKQKKKIYFKDVFRMLKVLENSMNYTFFGRYVDKCFYPKKMLRMYYNSYRKNKSRKLFCVSPDGSIIKEFDDKTLKQTLLQNYEPQKPYIEISCDLLEKKKKKKKKKKKNLKVVRSSRNNNNSYYTYVAGGLDLAQQFIDSFTLYLSKTTIYSNRKRFDFKFIKNVKYNGARLKKSSSDNKVCIDLSCDKKKCIIQEYTHHQKFGRMLILAEKYTVVLWCAAPNSSTHTKWLQINVRGGKRSKEVKKLFNKVKEYCFPEMMNKLYEFE